MWFMYFPLLSGISITFFFNKRIVQISFFNIVDVMILSIMINVFLRQWKELNWMLKYNAGFAWL